MPKPFQDRTGEKSIQAFLLEKRLVKQQSRTMTHLELSRRQSRKSIDAEIHGVRKELSTLSRGMTQLDNYFEKEKTIKDSGTIWFPLVRSHEDWEPKPCWIGDSAVNKHMCRYFPCRTMTSYHFIFRKLPDWVLEQADASVRKSKLHEKQALMTDDSSMDDATKNVNEMFPPINFPAEMTGKERKLKMIIRKKRIQNEIENKPSDRNVNYGAPTPVRRLQRPVRPVMRQMDIR